MYCPNEYSHDTPIFKNWWFCNFQVDMQYSKNMSGMGKFEHETLQNYFIYHTDAFWTLKSIFFGGYFLFKECNPPQIFGFLCMLVEIVICFIPAMLGFQKLMTLARGHLELASSNKSHYWQTWESSILATDVL